MQPQQIKPQTFQEVLAILREFINRDGNGVEAHRLWAVLTALRGPDDRNSEVKTATTEVIRHKVFGLKLINSVNAYSASDNITKLRFRLTDHTASSHFACHVGLAFQILGLKWDEVNLD